MRPWRRGPGARPTDRHRDRRRSHYRGDAATAATIPRRVGRLLWRGRLHDEPYGYDDDRSSTIVVTPPGGGPGGASRQRPAGPGFEPDPASLGPVLLVVPERLIDPVDGPLPFAPGVDPEPASFGPVLLAVPDRLVLPPLSAARAGAAAKTRPATTKGMIFMAYLPHKPAAGFRTPPVSRGTLRQRGCSWAGVRPIAPATPASSTPCGRAPRRA